MDNDIKVFYEYDSNMTVKIFGKDTTYECTCELMDITDCLIEEYNNYDDLSLKDYISRIMLFGFSIEFSSNLYILLEYRVGGFDKCRSMMM